MEEGKGEGEGRGLSLILDSLYFVNFSMMEVLGVCAKNCCFLPNFFFQYAPAIGFKAVNVLSIYLIYIIALLYFP